MSKFSRSWVLFKSSLQVIGQNKKLLIFPALVGFLTFLIILFFALPLAFWNTGHAFASPEHWKAVVAPWFSATDNADQVRVNPAGYALLAAFYMLTVFLATFFNVAFFNEILKALNGQSVSVTGGLRFAFSRIKAIFMWSLFTGVVGLIIKSLEERVGLLGRLVVRLIGIAWSVASIFVVPVIVREEENANPVKFLKGSAGILRKTWGESLIGYAGIQLSGLLVLLFSLVLLGTGIAASVMLNNFIIFGIVLAFWFVAIIAFSYLMNVASQVFRAALFIYATEGTVPGPFNQDQMEMAWKRKKK